MAGQLSAVARPWPGHGLNILKMDLLIDTAPGLAVAVSGFYTKTGQPTVHGVGAEAVGMLLPPLWCTSWVWLPCGAVLRLLRVTSDRMVPALELVRSMGPLLYK
jgi:hypothetical protein